MNLRVGQGWDIHRLVRGRPLVLGGVVVPSDRGEDGHSDGDALLHAIVDAMLGAIGAGDIGRHYPPSDERWKDARSSVFVEGAAGLLREAGYRVSNLDTTIVLEKPKLAPHIDAIRTSIAAMLDLDVGAVSVKAKTKEGLDSTGRLESVEAQAVVLVASIEQHGA